MRETQALVERVRRVSPELQQIDLAVDRSLMQIRPGQSLYVLPHEAPGWDPYLREQWIPVDLLPGRLVLEMSTGRALTPGQVMSVIAPVGSPIPLRAGIQHLLLIAENVLPTPFVLLARTLMGGGASVTLVLSGDAARYPLELLSPEIEILRGDVGWSWPDQVDTLQWADQVLVYAGEIDTYRRLYDTISQLRHQEIPDAFVCGLFYPRLGCGAGACHICEVPSRQGTLLACSDGPALDLKRLAF